MKVYYDNGLPLLVIGYEESSLTGYLFRHFMKIEARPATLITPEEFLSIQNKDHYQYAVAFNGDRSLRMTVIKILEEQQLNSPTFVHELAAVENTKLGAGVTIFPHCTIFDAEINNFCIVEPYTMLVHHSSLGHNVHVHPGTLFGGYTTIGNNCVFNLRSTVLPKVSICNDVEIGAVSTVTKNITIPGKYVGTVARRVGDITEMKL